MTPRGVLAALALAACRHRAAPPAPAGALAALHCEAPGRCRDDAGRAYDCAAAAVRTGVTHGNATTCRPAGGGAARAVLSGEVVDGDAGDGRRMPGARVVAWPAAGGARVATEADGDGRYRFLAPAGGTLFVRAEVPGTVFEQHAVTVPAGGWDVPVDVRHAATLARLLAGAADRDPARGMIVVEFAGAGVVAGAGARSRPAAPASLVFDAAGRPARGERLVEGGHRLVVLAGLDGDVDVEVLAPPGLRCAPQAEGVARWRVEPGVLTQVDVECREAGP